MDQFPWAIIFGAVVSMIILYYLISSAVSSAMTEHKELLKIQIELLKKLAGEKESAKTENIP